MRLIDHLRTLRRTFGANRSRTALTLLRSERLCVRKYT